MSPTTRGLARRQPWARGAGQGDGNVQFRGARGNVVRNGSKLRPVPERGVATGAPPAAKARATTKEKTKAIARLCRSPRHDGSAATSASSARAGKQTDAGCGSAAGDQSSGSDLDDDSEDDAFVARMRARLGKAKEEVGKLADAKVCADDGDGDDDGDGGGGGGGAKAGAGAGAGAAETKLGWDKDVDDNDW